MKTTIIPKGYRLTISSWENDLDSPRTEVLEGLSEEQVREYVALCTVLMDSQGPVSNLYDPSKEECNEVTDALLKALEPINKEISGDTATDMLWDIGLSSGEFYTRVCEDFKVEYLPEDVVFEDVTERFS